MANNTIAILMATYNGEKYLAERIDSILSQTLTDWHLYVHDDGSADKTIDIIGEYMRMHPDKITLMDYPVQGGAFQNFMSLLERIDASYYMFSDQDDVWLDSKIEMELAEMKHLEARNEGMPIIINSDLKVVDADLHVIHPSFWQYRGIYPDFIRHYYDFSATNVATGCTMLFNKKAKEVIHKPYTHAMMHDAWIALSVIACDGILYNLRTPTVLYRQHTDNSIGAIDVKTLTLKYRLAHIKRFVSIFYRQFKQLNAISRVSLLIYIRAKIRYRKYVRLQRSKQIY